MRKAHKKAFLHAVNSILHPHPGTVRQLNRRVYDAQSWGVNMNDPGSSTYPYLKNLRLGDILLTVDKSTLRDYDENGFYFKDYTTTGFPPIHWRKCCGATDFFFNYALHDGMFGRWRKRPFIYEMSFSAGEFIATLNNIIATFVGGTVFWADWTTSMYCAVYSWLFRVVMNFGWAFVPVVA